MRLRLTACVLAIGFATVGVENAFAQTNTFMLVPGIPGDSEDRSHVDWIDILSLTQTWGPAGKQAACTMQVVKSLDIAGPRLWAAAVTGQVFPEIRIEMFSAGRADGTSGPPVSATVACK